MVVVSSNGILRLCRVQEKIITQKPEVEIRIGLFGHTEVRVKGKAVAEQKHFLIRIPLCLSGGLIE